MLAIRAHKLSPVPLKQRSPEIYSLIADLSIKRLSSLAPDTAPQIIERPFDHDFVSGIKKAVIEVSSQSVRIVFKSCYDMTSENILPAKRRATLQNEAQKDHSISDFFREYNNQVAGGISQSLLEFGLSARISLPKTFPVEESALLCPEDSPLFSDSWRVYGPGYSYTCEAYVYLLDEKIERFVHQLKNRNEPEGSEIEFL